MDQEIRNKLRNVVTQCRRLLEEAITQELEGKYSIFAKKDQVTADPNAEMKNLTSQEDREARKDILDHFEHIKARGFKPKDALDQLIREIAFTHLNRLCAYKMMEAREVYVGGQKFREAVSRGVNSNGVKFYLAEHPEEERLFNTGHQDVVYRHFLDWLGGALSEEIGVLFNPNDPANRLYPRQKTLDEVLDLLNGGGIKAEETELLEQWPKIWSTDETIGWVYQYFTPKELRDQARKESQAPRNSYELAFRNQFFTPRYVVEFLTDNTLGRIWYEMLKGETKLKDQCRYIVRRASEIFLKDGEQPPREAAVGKEDLSQEELIKLPVHIQHRPKKDPRELKILDPACGSGHFLLYCFDLLLTIYEEAYTDPDLGPVIKKDYPTLNALKLDVPRLILAHNLHGIDIDLRASQIAALALWLRCQRVYQEMGLKKDRPKITRSNFICAEPMPGEEQMLNEFVSQLEPRVLGQVVEVVFNKMKMAGEAGSLLKIEEEIRDAVREAKRQYAIGGIPIQRTLFDKPSVPVAKVFSVKDITDAQFFESAEVQVIEALQSYAEKAQNGKHLQRRLFTEDAVRGFAFVDLCQKRYDVVLMNPPFGQSPPTCQDVHKLTYPNAYYDLSSAFVDSMLCRLNTDGKLGAITNRTIYFTSRLSRFRNLLLSKHQIPLFVDLGSGALDALVETSLLLCERRLPAKHSVISISDFTNSPDNSSAFVPSTLAASWRCRLQSSFISGNCEFSYAIPMSAFANQRTFKTAGYEVRQGLKTGDNFRFLRLRWEVPSSLIGTKWCTYSKGGDYAPFYYDLHLVIDWSPETQELYSGNTTVFSCLVTKNKHKYALRPGLTYTTRTTSPLSVRILPAGSIFDGRGSAIFSDTVKERSEDPSTLLWALAVLNSNATQVIIDSKEAAAQSAARSYREGMLSELPISPFKLETHSEWCSQIDDIVRKVRQVYSYSEVSATFLGLVTASCTSIRDLLKEENELRANVRFQMDVIKSDSEIARQILGPALWTDNEKISREIYAKHGRRIHDELAPSTEEDVASRVLSQLLGVIFGRWDVRQSTKLLVRADKMPLLQSLPVTPTIALTEPIGDEYPLKLAFDGIIPDDKDHPNDLVKSLRGILDWVWKNRAEAFEREACDILIVDDFREFFRKLGAGGFWDDHMSRYTKSRRKAPIYWLLQSSKKNYALWVYYHRLDKDLLFKALVNYVEPKIRLEASRLDSLRTLKAAAGDSGKEAKRLAKDVEKQEDFLSELRDFEDKLRRAANLHLEPDLNDGVVLNIAPLWELVPWKEARKHWNELLEGQYEWSSIGKQLRQKGFVK
jgi:hypothetical protein